jgi:hypothetical protein
VSMFGNALRAGIEALVKPYAEQLVEAIREAQADRGAWVVRNFRREQPLFAGFAESFFTGTPEEALAALAPLWPEVEQVPNAAAVVGEIQKHLREGRV